MNNQAISHGNSNQTSVVNDGVGILKFGRDKHYRQVTVANLDDEGQIGITGSELGREVVEIRLADLQLLRSLRQRLLVTSSASGESKTWW
jgi:hypothetical protein